MTHELGGENYVLWGGREGYETLLNTDMGLELDNLGRFLNLVVEHKHKIGFKGAILIEPKPHEPTKHQYDFDTATVYGFLKRYGLEQEVKVNLEQNHALLAGHTFEHEIVTAQALGILGSIDMNRGDELLGWDTDQFPNNLPQMALAIYHIVKGGGLGQGGFNFDAKLRRQSIDPDDMVVAHAEAMDLCARALLIAEKMIVDDKLGAAVKARYAGWEGGFGQDIIEGRMGTCPTSPPTWPGPASIRSRARADRSAWRRWSTATSDARRRPGPVVRAAHTIMAARWPALERPRIRLCTVPHWGKQLISSIVERSNLAPRSPRRA